jgi:hypothetical protein
MATKIKRHKKIPHRADCCPDHKIVYPSKRVALEQAAKSDLTLTPYKCPHCKEWHLTSSENQDKPKVHKQLLFRGCCLTFEEGYWTCPSLPDRIFIELKDIKTAIAEYLKTYYGHN